LRTAAECRHPSAVAACSVRFKRGWRRQVCATVTQRNTRHASSTSDATYTSAEEIDFLARFEVEECACACNGNALVHPVALLKTLGDLSFNSVADVIVAVLLPARQNNNHNNNNNWHSGKHVPLTTHPAQLTMPTSVTMSLLFKPSAIKRPPTSVNSLSLCITRRHKRRKPQASSHIHIRTSRVLALCHASPPSHAPAYQSDHLQALESAEACAQRLNVVILQLLQRAA